MSGQTACKSFSELVQNFFCQRLQMQQRVSGHTLASYRDTFRLGFEFIRKKTGRAASQQTLEDWDAPNTLRFLDHLERNAVANRARVTPDWQPFVLSCVTSASKNLRP